MSEQNDHLVDGTLPEGKRPEDMLNLLRAGEVTWAIFLLIIIGIVAMFSLPGALLAAFIAAGWQTFMSTVSYLFGRPYRRMIKERDNG